MDWVNKVGRMVYTVNNKTNDIDEWKCTAVVPAKEDILCQLVSGKKMCMLPTRCVFLTRHEAEIIAGMK